MKFFPKVKFLLSASGLAVIAGSAAQSQSDVYIGGELGILDHSLILEDRDFDWYGHTQDFDTLGLTFGGYAGVNQIDGNRLTGWEFGLRLSEIDDSHVYSAIVRIDTELSFSARATRRFGISIDDTSLYLLGGAALSNTESSWTEFLDPADSWPNLASVKPGLVLGFGLEHRLNDRWSVRGQFTSETHSGHTVVNGLGFPLHVQDRVNSVSLGFSYALGDTSFQPSAFVEGTPARFEGTNVGAHIGLASRNVSQNDINFAFWHGSYDVAQDGPLAGVSIGHNWQNGASVFGLRAQVQTGALGSSFSAGLGGFTSDTAIDEMVSLQAQMGTAFGNNQLYVLGGVTTANVDNMMFEDASGRYAGLTIGAGVESLMSDQLSWNAEATFTMFTGNEDDAGAAFLGSADILQVSAGLKYYLGAETRRMGTGTLRPTHDWSGPYFGIDTAVLANQATVQDIDFNVFGGEFDLKTIGAGFGGHIGHNWQDGNFVYGAVADLAYYSNGEARSGFSSIESEVNAVATLRTRAGIATGNSPFFTLPVDWRWPIRL